MKILYHTLPFFLFTIRLSNLGVVTNSTEHIFLLKNKAAASIPFIIKIISLIYGFLTTHRGHSNNLRSAFELPKVVALNASIYLITNQQKWFRNCQTSLAFIFKTNFIPSRANHYLYGSTLQPK